MRTIYTPGRGLGDNWYTINKLLREHREAVWISHLSRPERARAVNVGERLKEILPLLDAPIERIRLTPAKPTNYKTGFHDLPWDVEYYHTHMQWIPNSSTTVCYQFDGRFMKEKGGLPSESLLEEVFVELTQKGYGLQRLGASNSLEEIVTSLASCRCFLGTSSGVSHIAHSVGVPLCLIEGDYPFQQYHHSKQITFAVTAEEVVSFVEVPS